MQTLPRSAAFALAGLAACSSLPSAPSQAPAPPPSQAELEDLPTFDGHTGQPVSFSTLLDAIDQADIVVLGELHGHPVGLPLHAALFAVALERHPGTALALEFLSRDTQHLVDAYLTDLITFDELTEALAHVRGSSATDHAPLIELAKQHAAPVFAANAPRTYTTLVRTENFAALDRLTAHQHSLFDVPPGVPNDAYRARFFETMAPMFAPGGVHAQDVQAASDEAALPADAALEQSLDAETHAQIEGLFRAQTLWDGTMSASVVNAWRAGFAPAFLVIGSFHVNHDGGTLQFIRERAPDARVVLISFEDRDALALDEADLGLADYVIYAGPFSE